MLLKKWISTKELADLDMCIFYFRSRPFAVMDLYDKKIYFNESGLEWLRTHKQAELPLRWVKNKYLPSKNWVGFAMDRKKNDVTMQVIEDYYLATYNMLLKK